MRKSSYKKYRKIAAIGLPILVVVALAVWYLSQHTIAVLQPAGQVGQKERNLMVVALLLAATVVIPVYIMTVMIILKYRESNHERKAIKYNPDWDHSRPLETLWWGIPIVIITVLSVITWNSSHSLDPFKPIDSNKPTMNVQVVALDWKWLFIYPDQHIASVNLAEMPVGTPVDFYITSDTVMNSFWIPQLGGQIYAMPGMSTQMHLVANKVGSFNGWSANISGEGFADMTFMAKGVSNKDFANWVDMAEKSTDKLTLPAYNQLARPSEGSSVRYYSAASASLYNDVIMKYMAPAGVSPMSSSPTGSSSNTMEMSTQ